MLAPGLRRGVTREGGKMREETSLSSSLSFVF